MRLWFLLMAGGVTAFSQPFGFGVRAGVPLNDLVSTVRSPNFGFSSTTNRYIIGPMAELRLPFGLGIEVDALYRHFNFQGTAPSPITGTTLFTSANSGAWEFPLLAKFRFPSKVIRPYVDGGVAWDTLTGLEQSVRSVLPLPPITTSPLVRHNTTSGFVLGAGLDVHVLIIHLQPEVRYTRCSTFSTPMAAFRATRTRLNFCWELPSDRASHQTRRAVCSPARLKTQASHAGPSGQDGHCRSSFVIQLGAAFRGLAGNV